MPLRAPTPGTFEHLLQAVHVPADSLLRLTRYPNTEPYWSRGRYRFDGPAAPGGFGTCYAASDVTVAFCESVIHESAWFNNGRWVVPADDLTSRHIVTLQRPEQPTLVLADLTGQALKQLGLNNDISASDDYAASMAWAQAIHDGDTRWDGLLYV